MSVEIENVAVVRVTEKALLVRLSDDEEVWVPRSQIEDDSEIGADAEKGAEGTLVVSDFIAKAKGWL